MTTEASTFPRFGFPLAPPRMRVVSEWMSTRERSKWPEPPDGNGRPVMLVPGFMAGDTSLTRMAVWLREGGFTLARSGIRWNTGCIEPTVVELQRRLERATDEAGQPALLIGQSRGGSIGRAISVLSPHLIDTLVTLGSPLLDQLAVKPRVWPSIITVGTLGTLGVPGMFSVSCLRGSCCRRTIEATTASFPEPIRFISVYSRSDEIVRWEACLDESAEQLEVDTSHMGMGMDRDVWSALSAQLSMPRP
jgi:pimeloyl-ACP methyl ester carboxylesterase